MKKKFHLRTAVLALLLPIWSGCHHGPVVPPSHPLRSRLPHFTAPPEVVTPCPAPCGKARLGLPLDGAGMPMVEPEPQPIDLATALRLTQAQNPWVLAARERVREALALQDRAELRWVPDLVVTPAYNRHDGQIQRFNGQVLTISRSSVAALGGPSLSLYTADAFYGPLVAQQMTTARTAGAAAETNEQLLDVAIIYFDLLQAHGEVGVVEETLKNAREMYDILLSYQKAGKVAMADVVRARTEMNQRERELVQSRARAKIISARLAEQLSLPAHLTFLPAEGTVVPLALVPETTPLEQLLAQGLQFRPELMENRAYVEAALHRWRAAKVGPWLPSLDLDYRGGGFGGGTNSYIGEFNTRGEFTAMATWRLKNLGLGNRAEQEATQSQAAQANFRLRQVENMITSQVARSYHLALSRHRELPPAQDAVAAARESFQLNLDRIRKAPEESRPIELLQAIQALNRMRLDYLHVLTDYNRAQFQLFTALGYPPICALNEGAEAALPEAAPAPRPLPPGPKK